MNEKIFAIALIAGLSAGAAAAQTSKPAAKKMAPAAHVILTPGDLKWGPAPPVLPAGAQVAVLDGDPFKPGFFTLRLKFPDGYKIPVHTHPTDENIVVISGTFRAGMGDAFSDAGLHEFPAGSFLKMPKEMRHFAAAKGEVVVQIYGNGPFVVNYVNPSDDPTKKSSTTSR
ncbi:MAG TPA: cupin domain-containing protein [Vicinamibacterales bacterium]|jgi:quercetin dioxygenase-like cupin family protein|nr:cupin domain-containing protein [Vicinamibacterales bacterium]